MIQVVVGVGYFGDHAEIRFIGCSVIISSDVVKGARHKIRFKFSALDVAIDDHLVETGRQKINHVKVADDLIVFLFGDGTCNKNPQMADVLVNDVNNDLPVPFDIFHGVVNARNPVERLLGRGNIIAH